MKKKCNLIECTRYKSSFQKRKDWNQPSLHNSCFVPGFSFKTLALPQGGSGKTFLLGSGEEIEKWREEPENLHLLAISSLPGSSI